MNTENVVKHLRALWRTDRIIADIRLRHLLVGLGLRAFAALIAAFGLLMLELSAYFALVQTWSAIAAAAILGAVNFAIAAALFAIAGRAPSGRDIELANEIHDTSIEASSARGACAPGPGVRRGASSAQHDRAGAAAVDRHHHQELADDDQDIRRGKFG